MQKSSARWPRSRKKTAAAPAAAGVTQPPGGSRKRETKNAKLLARKRGSLSRDRRHGGRCDHRRRRSRSDSRFQPRRGEDLWLHRRGDDRSRGISTAPSLANSSSRWARKKRSGSPKSSLRRSRRPSNPRQPTRSGKPTPSSAPAGRSVWRASSTPAVAVRNSWRRRTRAARGDGGIAKSAVRGARNPRDSALAKIASGAAPPDGVTRTERRPSLMDIRLRGRRTASTRL